jgi:hypothetical protein
MVMGEMNYEDACRVILYTNPTLFDISPFSLWDERNRNLESILEADLSEEQESYIYEIQRIKLDAQKAHAVLGVIRPCCRKLLNDPPIAPVFSSTQPEGSMRIMDKGLVTRVVTRENSTYKIDNYHE